VFDVLGHLVYCERANWMPRVRQFAASEAGAAEVSERLQGQRATVTDVFGKKGQQSLQ
jgi:hypothetical protein